MKKKSVLITGAAGFIGFHLTNRLIRNEKYELIALDNLNNYYSPQLKLDRLKELGFPEDELMIALEKATYSVSSNGIKFYKADLADKQALEEMFACHRPQIVVNLAAQAGVRYSLQNPYAYLHSNISGFLNLLECCRAYPVEHLIYASSSSVYGLSELIPFAERNGADHPLSFYGASKRANELFAHSYSQNFGLTATGLRFFTVYGPWGRPDMAYYKFAEKILAGEEIEVYNNGRMERDFTYIDDIVSGMVKLFEKRPKPFAPEQKLTPDRSTAPFRIYNIGNNRPEKLLDFISLLEDFLGKKAKRKFLPLQIGDVERTWADIGQLEAETGFRPQTTLREGLKKFVDWLLEYKKRSAKR